jgi:hypothetical protein
VFDDARAQCIQSSLEDLARTPADREANPLGADESEPRDASAVFTEGGIVFFCVGTQAKVAGKAGQIKLELTDTVAVATAARAAGVTTCAVLTSRGASATSRFGYCPGPSRAVTLRS